MIKLAIAIVVLAAVFRFLNGLKVALQYFDEWTMDEDRDV